MPLKGQAKTDYQRDYMKRYRSNKGKALYPVRPAENVRPEPLDPVRSVQYTEVVIGGVHYKIRSST